MSSAFKITPIGKHELLVEREDPKHGHIFELSPDGKRIIRCTQTLPNATTPVVGDPILVADQYESAAREAATEYLRRP
jgi:hypothetical protein